MTRADFEMGIATVLLESPSAAVNFVIAGIRCNNMEYRPMRRAGAVLYQLGLLENHHHGTFEDSCRRIRPKALRALARSR